MIYIKRKEQVFSVRRKIALRPPEFRACSGASVVNRNFMSAAVLHYDHPSSRILVNEAKAPEISESADGTHQAIGIEILCQQQEYTTTTRIYFTSGNKLIFPYNLQNFVLELFTYPDILFCQLIKERL